MIKYPYYLIFLKKSGREISICLSTLISNELDTRDRELTIFDETNTTERILSSWITNQQSNIGTRDTIKIK